MIKCPYCLNEFDTIKEVKLHCREYCEHLNNMVNVDFQKICEDINIVNHDFVAMINKNEQTDV